MATEDEGRTLDLEAIEEEIHRLVSTTPVETSETSGTGPMLEGRTTSGDLFGIPIFTDPRVPPDVVLFLPGGRRPTEDELADPLVALALEILRDRGAQPERGAVLVLDMDALKRELAAWAARKEGGAG